MKISCTQKPNTSRKADVSMLNVKKIRNRIRNAKTILELRLISSFLLGYAGAASAAKRTAPSRNRSP